MATYSGIKPGDEAELERIAVDFLKATDVPRGLWNESIKIIEVYDHKRGGKILVIEYVTMNMGHPEFMLEAAEGHIAILTVNGEGQVVSAFCLHGPKIWDLINQRWISTAIHGEAAIIPEQQAIMVGRDFLNSIGRATGMVLSVELEERTPNFYWHDIAGLEKPDAREPRLCWIIRFEQAGRPGHFFEVWIDAHTGEVLGGQQCRC